VEFRYSKVNVHTMCWSRRLKHSVLLFIILNVRVHLRKTIENIFLNILVTVECVHNEMFYET
jgi:hypothetical protein